MTTKRNTAGSRKATSRVKSPKPLAKRFIGHALPGIKPSELTGRLIVIEGADGSGRSTQIRRLVDWLEASGHATTQVGLKRSNLASEELESAKNGNILNRIRLDGDAVKALHPVRVESAHHVARHERVNIPVRQYDEPGTQ